MNRGTRWTIFDVLAVAVLVSFSALRSDVGTDFSMYNRLYTSLVPSLPWWPQIQASQQEVGYSTLSLFLRELTASPHAIFWASALLTVVPAYVAVKRESRDPGLAILLYVLLAFYVSPFNIVRQGIAISLNFLAGTYLGRSRLMFIALNIVATLFHTTAGLAALFQWVAYRWKPNGWSVLGISILTGIFSTAVFAIPTVSSWLARISPRYEAYVTSADAAGLGTYLLVVAQIALVILCLYLSRKTGVDSWLGIVALSLVFLVLGIQVVAAARMQYYFGIFLVLLLPNQIAKMERGANVVRFILIAGGALYFGFHLANYGDLLPYRTYLGPGGAP
ncbi:EpsG family protein [Curtobacterium sp. MCBD17_030]|uniref:EpsG family protein n=1 Tax=Curtobacterium sp. MCBD17_030 TaxID=2175649 RepID=UPI0021AC31B7|nr:EpsG family protein [Curtobacterium sp. MCBD17_030]